jgi:hypothetical protein
MVARFGSPPQLVGPRVQVRQAEVDDGRQPAAVVVHVPFGEVPVDDQQRQLVGADRGQGVVRLQCRRLEPVTQPAAVLGQRADARCPVERGVRGVPGVLRAPAGALPDSLAEAAQRQVQPGQVTATAALLRGTLPATRDGAAGHVPGQAVEEAVVLAELSQRSRDDPSAPGEMIQHRMLVGEVPSCGPGVIPAQHHARAAAGLRQPAPVLER